MDEAKFVQVVRLADLDDVEETFMRRAYGLTHVVSKLPLDKTKWQELYNTASGKFSEAWRRLYGQRG
ncbi:MAG: hypothetical protein AAB364_01655 [Patescibacteria group bacterium]